MSNSKQKLRILVASHSHPDISNGGAEIAAYQLYKGLAAHKKTEAVFYLGCDRDASADKAGAVFVQPFDSPNEFLYAMGAFDWFKFANQDPRFPAAFRSMLAELKPDIVHFHHYINFGVEAFLHVREVLPQAKILLTLHEYLAICNYYGQMVTKGHRNLCYQSSPARCHKCFPERHKADFFLRQQYINRFFGLIDLFVAPSQFLAGRYAAWGIPEKKIAVLENMMPHAGEGAIALPPADGPLRLGFFGQISALKGIDVLFDAAALLEKEELGDVSFDIFGDYRGQPPEFQKMFLDRLETAGTNIRFHGPYDRQRVDRLMQSVHAVLVPSIWWENSPVVIQEALRNRRPVLCSDIGGMAEKVRDGIDGFHFSAGSPIALATLVRRLTEDRAKLASLTAKLTGEPELISGLPEYMAMYDGLMKAGTAEPAALIPPPAPAKTARRSGR
jgi:glycosyltransferase involved in cell wall biosynthesis